MRRHLAPSSVRRPEARLASCVLRKCRASLELNRNSMVGKAVSRPSCSRGLKRESRLSVSGNAACHMAYIRQRNQANGSSARGSERCAWASRWISRDDRLRVHAAASSIAPQNGAVTAYIRVFPNSMFCVGCETSAKGTVAFNVPFSYSCAVPCAASTTPAKCTNLP